MNDLTKMLNELLCAYIEKGEVAGANILVVKDDEELVYTEAGYANVENKRLFVRDTISRIYSMTKPITSAAAMLLMERGQLELGQPVDNILESFRNQQVWENNRKVPVKRSLLIKDLLSMTSGLTYPDMDAAGGEVCRIYEDIDRRIAGKNAVSTKEFAERIGRCALTFHPGDRWMYGTSADILGAVIEKITGVSLGEFFQNEIFEPLGMKDTAFYVPQEKLHRLADVYERSENGMKLFENNHLGVKYIQTTPPAFESGGAGLKSTIDDYAKFAGMLMNMGEYGDKQILDKETVRFMTTGKLMPWQQESMWRSWDSLYGYNYGNLMRIMEEPGMAMYHTWKGEYSWDGWLGTYFCNSPSNKVTILMTCQRRDSGMMDMTKRMRNIIKTHMS